MNAPTRRKFLADVGRGMLVASVGASLAGELGISPAWADAEGKRLDFGSLESLASLMQETPPDKLQPVLVHKLEQGTELKTLVAAGALANAREFGGNDYIGFHTFMALGPAYHMAQELPAAQQALPVLKVLYRNASRMQAVGGRKDTLIPVEYAELPAGEGGEIMQQASRGGDYAKAESTFATLAKGPPGEAFNHLQFAVQDEVDVHRVVLCWRAFSTLDLTGAEHAQALLRQSVRYCVQREADMKSRNQSPSAIRTLLPKLLDQFKLLGRSAGDKRAEDGWINNLAQQIANSSREQAAEAVAAALAEGFIVEDVGEALSLAANALLLRDQGRPPQWANAEKPAGSTHGDSIGVHASDAANAWRNIARASNPRNQIASMIVGAFHTGGQLYGGMNKEPYPFAEHLEKVAAKEPDALLAELETAVKAKDQLQACAVVQKYGLLGHSAKPIFDLLLKYGISEDGALHAEKYYRTVSEEFATHRAPFKWRQLAALARVTASEYGRPAPGVQQARELLKV